WPSPRAFTLELVMTPTRSTPFRNRPDHPLRPPDWRWLRAANLWDQGDQPSEPWDDAWVRRALRLYRELQQGKDPQPGKRTSDLWQAYRLYSGESLLRWEAEARLLVEPPAQVAAKCGVTWQILHAYEKVFFNVRDRLGATGYLVSQVLGGNLAISLREDHVGRILKLFALSGGGRVLAAVLEDFRPPLVVPERPALLSAAG